ncbi:CLUMA_CG013547, isoform A [Clunio marinus]|uniref:CLUMA_CG013547, isoform A n=1 Tax=Clunio marinus TaxID=568069 RepID=A0A1J1IKI2_9DIPT|nr:CLUMA_CG013547, isoform A [Clunio marinus]
MAYLNSDSNSIKDIESHWRQPSEIFDNFFDSISNYSESTVANSEFVANQIRKFENDQTLPSQKELNKPQTVFNLHIDKFVIDGNKDGGSLNAGKNSSTEAVNIKFKTFDTLKKSQTKKSPIQFVKAFFSNRYIAISVFLLLVLMIATSTSFLLLSKDDSESTTTTTSTSTTTTQSSTQSTSTAEEPTSTSESSSSDDPTTTTISTSTTTTTRTTTSEPEFELNIIKRSTWSEEGLGIQGKYKQISPLSKIIILNTKSNDYTHFMSSTEFLIDHQQNSYPEYDDLKENFIVALDGTIYEGRGFSHEGQTTFDSLTSYNNKAVAINFLLTEDDQTLNSIQEKAFCKFLEESISTGSVKENATIFHHSSLLKSYFETFEMPNLDCSQLENVEWKKSLNIFKRRDWNASEFPPDFEPSLRRKATKFRVTKMEVDESVCDSMDSCSNFIKDLQTSYENEFDDVPYNFVITINNFIFEALGFDITCPGSYESICILYVGNDISNEIIVGKIAEFITFAIDLEKLSRNFEITYETLDNNNNKKIIN